MISERTYDTKDWSNDAENLALIAGINKMCIYILMENLYFKVKL